MAFNLFKKKNTGADSIYYGGNIYTLDSDVGIVSAVACKNGRVLALGDDESIMALEDENTVMFNLEGDYVLPGLIDHESHPVLNAFSHCTLYLSDKLNKNQVLEALKEYINNNKDAEAYFSYGFNRALFDVEKSQEEALLLDALSKDKPVALLSMDANVLWLNSISIKQVRESAIRDKLPTINIPYILYVLAPFHSEEIERETLRLAIQYKNLGFTSVLSCGEPDYMQGLYQQSLVDMYQRGTHLQRYIGAYPVMRDISIEVLVQRLLQRKTICMELDDNFNYNMLKLVVDSNDSLEKLNSERLLEICMAIGDKGFDIHIDAIGSQALIDSFYALSRVRASGYKRNTFIICHNEDLKEINMRLEDPIDFESAQIIDSLPTIKSYLSNNETFILDFTRFESIEDLIDHYTVKAAEAVGFENQLGAIKTGYYADFAIYKTNPFQTSIKEFSDLEISETVINGLPTGVGDMSVDDDFFDELEDYDEERAGLDGLRGLDNLGGIV